MSQPACIDKILEKFYLNQAKILNTLIKETILLPNENIEATAAKIECYQEITSFMIFFIVETRPDSTYVMLIVSRFANNLLYLHRKVVKTIFCYFKAIKNIGITYKREQKRDLTIKKYSNSN